MVIQEKVKKYLIENTYTYLFGSMCDFDCVLHDLNLIQDKIETIDFEDRQDSGDDLNKLICYSFPNFPRNSFIVSLMILIENEFRSIFKTLSIIENYPIDWNDLRGNSLEKVLIGVQNLSKINIDNITELKIKMIGFIETRNCIVHSNSNIYEFGKPKIVKDFIESLSDCTIQDGVVSFSKKGCNECLDLGKIFISTIYMSIMKKYPENVIAR